MLGSPPHHFHPVVALDLGCVYIHIYMGCIGDLSEVKDTTAISGHNTSNYSKRRLMVLELIKLDLPNT